jgi:methionyl aminopeptidase
MRKVCRLAREVLDITAAAMKPGVTTDYLDAICHNACIERDVGAIQNDFQEKRKQRND